MARRSVLVVDDERVWHQLLARLLRGLCYEVYAVSTCSEGARLAEQHMPDCIVLDFHLGDGSAVQMCSMLRANRKTAGIPVIILSADPETEITAYAECKAACFVLKGTHLMTLLPAVIGKVLSGSRFRSLISGT